MKIRVAVGVLLVLSPALASALTYEQAKVLADRDEASLSPKQQQALIESQGTAGGAAHSTCLSGRPKPDLSPYTVVMQLDASGKVVHTWLQGSSPLAVCFNQEMGKATLFVPPRAPFYTSFEMSWKP